MNYTNQGLNKSSIVERGNFSYYACWKSLVDAYICHVAVLRERSIFIHFTFIYISIAAVG